MKTCTLEGFEAIQVVCPNAHLEIRDGVEVVVVPTFDFDTDTPGERVMQLVRSADAPKFKAGDVLRHTETGSPFNIVDPFIRMLRLRKGPKSE